MLRCYPTPKALKFHGCAVCSPGCPRGGCLLERLGCMFTELNQVVLTLGFRIWMDLRVWV